MQKQLINQAMMLFDTSDKWNSFLELAISKDEIRNQWYQKLKSHVTQRFCETDILPGWSFFSWNHWDFKWYLTEFGKDSFCVWMYGHRIGLWANSNSYDTQKIAELLNSDKYSLIMSVLRTDEIHLGDWKLVEYGNFEFNSPHDSHFDADRLGWYAGNETEKFTEQILEKVNRIRKNKDIMNLFIEVNRLSKK